MGFVNPFYSNKINVHGSEETEGREFRLFGAADRGKVNVWGDGWNTRVGLEKTGFICSFAATSRLVRT